MRKLRIGALCLFIAGNISCLQASATIPINIRTENKMSAQELKQDKGVKVMVSDQFGPIAGANVVEKGTTNGGITNMEGEVTITAKTGATLLVSFIGYTTKEVQITGNILEVILTEDTELLDEVVVVGYGSQKKVNLTGAITEVGDKALKNRVAHNVAGMLQGAVPGLNITTSSGVPGSSPALNIRGVTSINDAEPLVLIDGAEGDLNRVNSNDIESISVIKDASAAAIYGARAAFGVILVTTKNGIEQEGKATVRYSGRMGWEMPTTSTDYENTGYWSVYTINQFWKADSGTLYVNYTDKDMQELLARVNDKTENPERPWVVEDVRNGRKQWVYYGNYDWWDMMYRNTHPVQQHNLSISGGTKDVKYMVSGAYDYQKGILRTHPDIYRKYNLRAKIDFRINPYATMSNNTSFYGSQYTYQGDGGIENTIAYNARHALACFPMKNPDGSWLYSTPYINYKVGNGRHIIAGEGSHRNVDRTNDFSNTTRLVIKPIEQLSLTADFTYRLYQTRNTSRSNPLYYREYPDADLAVYETGAGANRLDENIKTQNYYSFNAFANYDDTFGEAHHVSGVFGFNYETQRNKNVSAYGEYLSSSTLDDLNLVGQNSNGETITGVGGGQSEYALAGFFGRLNYDYKSRYLLELSGRYDGSSRFARGNRWGFFPSASVGWRMSEESFFQPAREWVDNLKIRASFGSLGNQNVSSYYTFIRLVSLGNLNYSFNEGSAKAKYASLGSPIASDLTWEKSQQWDLGFDLTMLNNRLTWTADIYVRDTKDMLTDGIELPSVYGATVPQMNTADLRTKGYEMSLTWRDKLTVGRKPLEYSIGFNISDYQSHITKYDNHDKTFAKSYYEGMRLGEIWGFVTDGLFSTTEEAQAYAKEVDLSYINKRITGGWQAGDLKFVDLDGDGKLGIGQNNVENPGDRKILGNSLPSFQYGFNASVSWLGFDVSAFFQGTGNHHWYPGGQTMQFWGPYGYPYLSYLQKDFLKDVWSEENPDAYFTRPMAYSASSGPLSKVNDRYLQNVRYLRFKNLTIGYTIPKTISAKVGLEQARFYFTGENLCYWSPLKKRTKYIDPEAAFNRSTDAYNNAWYPWQKTFMFGIDITF